MTCIFCCDAGSDFDYCRVCGRGEASVTNCPIREHTGDGAYIGRCDHYVAHGYCPRHGLISLYKNDDDRDVPISRRFHDPLGRPEQRKEIWFSIAYVLANQFRLKYAWHAWKFSRMDDPPREWPEGHPLHHP